ncbi:hypothetical protein ACU4GD_17195 [Cupriavidus basilensis]
MFFVNRDAARAPLELVIVPAGPSIALVIAALLCSFSWLSEDQISLACR